jgi:hypothetical protein
VLGAAVDVLVPVGEGGTGLVGAALDLARPPATDVGDGGERFLSGAVGGEGDGGPPLA